MSSHPVRIALISVVASAACVFAASAMTFASVNVTLPSGDDGFPAGPNVQVIDNNCLGCHSRDMVLYQPAMTRSDWAKEVDKMRKAYKAPVNESDVAAIVDYLAAAKGKP